MGSETQGKLKSFMLSVLQDAVDADMEEYHQLRYLAKNHPSTENTELYQKKREYLIKCFNLTESDFECLDKEFDQRRFMMFYGHSPHGH